MTPTDDQKFFLLITQQFYNLSLIIKDGGFIVVYKTKPTSREFI